MLQHAITGDPDPRRQAVSAWQPVGEHARCRVPHKGNEARRKPGVPGRCLQDTPSGCISRNPRHQERSLGAGFHGTHVASVGTSGSSPPKVSGTNHRRSPVSYITRTEVEVPKPASLD